MKSQPAALAEQRVLQALVASRTVLEAALAGPRGAWATRPGRELASLALVQLGRAIDQAEESVALAEARRGA